MPRPSSIIERCLPGCGKMASLSPSKGEEVEEDEENVSHPNREEEEIKSWEDFATFKQVEFFTDLANDEQGWMKIGLQEEEQKKPER